VTEDVVHDSHDSHNDPEHIRREIRVYKIIFASLLVLTVLTVGVIKIGDVPVHYAIMIALAIALTKGFLLVSSSPLTRSSHHAGDDFAKLKAARLSRLGR